MIITKEEVIDLEYALADAIKNNDQTFIEGVLHDDLLFLAPNGQVITKQLDLESHKSGEMIVEELQIQFEGCKIMDDTIISIVVYDTKGIMLSTPISGKFRYIRTWKKFPDGYKIINGACIQLQ